MSEAAVQVIRVGPVTKHPNADSLSITSIGGPGGYPCIFRTGDYSEGDLAVYVPIDSIVPNTDPRWSFLDKARIRAKKLRGVFSMGLLTNAEPGWVEGQDVTELLAITHWTPGEEGNGKILSAQDEPDPGFMPCYDLEGLRKYSSVIQPGEEVWISEKIHGCSARFAHDGERLWVGSHKRIKKDREDSQWWQIARAYELETKLATIPGMVLYGEIYGSGVQDITYGLSLGAKHLAAFDILDSRTHQWLDYHDFREICHMLAIPVVPTLYEGPWSDSLRDLCEGNSTLPLATHVREGIVVVPLSNRRTLRIDRKLKLHGQGYLLRKEK
jgi:RNA ligase (TIGR02306 family)